jgi:hypothetical protein
LVNIFKVTMFSLLLSESWSFIIKLPAFFLCTRFGRNSYNIYYVHISMRYRMMLSGKLLGAYTFTG